MRTREKDGEIGLAEALEYCEELCEMAGDDRPMHLTPWELPPPLLPRFCEVCGGVFFVQRRSQRRMCDNFCRGEAKRRRNLMEAGG